MSRENNKSELFIPTSPDEQLKLIILEKLEKSKVVKKRQGLLLDRLKTRDKLQKFGEGVAVVEVPIIDPPRGYPALSYAINPESENSKK